MIKTLQWSISDWNNKLERSRSIKNGIHSLFEQLKRMGIREGIKALRRRLNSRNCIAWTHQRCQILLSTELPPHICCIVSRDGRHRFSMLSSKIGMLPLVSDQERPQLEFTMVPMRLHMFMMSRKVEQLLQRLLKMGMFQRAWFSSFLPLCKFIKLRSMCRWSWWQYQWFMLLNISSRLKCDFHDEEHKNYHLLSVCQKFIWLFGCLTSYGTCYRCWS